MFGHSEVEHVLSFIRERFGSRKQELQFARYLQLVFAARGGHRSLSCRKWQLYHSVNSGMLPFTYAGYDFFGPFMVKRSCFQKKCYGIPFRCLVAVHIEVIHSMDTYSFIHTLRCFIARIGKPQEMLSDNGTSFVGGNCEIKQAVKQWNIDKFSLHFLLQKVISTPNPPKATQMGGVWERVIRSTR